MMTVEEWQERLEKAFTSNGIIGAQLVSVIEQEQKYGIYINRKFHGQNILMESFQAIFIESIRLAIRNVYITGWPEDKPYYPMTILYYLTMFRRLRAAENLIRCGYPLDGYSLLRDLKDRTIFLAAIPKGITSLLKIIGDTGNEKLTEENYKKIKNSRKNEERKVLNKMIRKESGFDSATLEELNRWENMFHEEVHGSRMTLFLEMGLWRKQEKLSIGPIPHELAYGMYMNRAVEIGWLITRLLPLLQLKPKSFGDEWAEKWHVLDDSFRVMVKGLESIGKGIATAFIHFVDTQFLFSPEHHYMEF